MSGSLCAQARADCGVLVKSPFWARPSARTFQVRNLRVAGGGGGGSESEAEAAEAEETETTSRRRENISFLAGARGPLRVSSSRPKRGGEEEWR